MIRFLLFLLLNPFISDFRIVHSTLFLGGKLKNSSLILGIRWTCLVGQTPHKKGTKMKVHKECRTKSKSSMQESKRKTTRSEGKKESKKNRSSTKKGTRLWRLFTITFSLSICRFFLLLSYFLDFFFLLEHFHPHIFCTVKWK